ncbi:MAG: hypothetical protein IJF67_12485 [Clostridia bacterium]|nr:hypothetical protein [Clostridia bacterium]
MSKQSIRFENLKGNCLYGRNWTTEGRSDCDFWRIFIDTGENRELAVYSSEQHVANVAQLPGVVVRSYDRLIAEDGQIFNIKLVLTVTEENGHLVYTSSIENHSPVIVNELQFPFIPAKSFGCAPEEEVLYIPEGLGARIPNPRRRVSMAHTEYMSADYKSTWMTHSYPASSGSRPVSMPWMGLQCGDKFLYFGEHNPELRIVGLNVGVPPRHAESELMFAISHYPAVREGETVAIGRSVVALFEGDWRDGAAFYRDWAEKTWYREQQIPEWVKNMSGWQRVICKHQYGEIFWKYSDLPRLWEEGHRCGLDGLLLFGWWKGRFDNNYPEYECDPALGGEKGLRDAISQIQKMGGHVLLYTNGNLIDIKTDFYRRIGQKISHKDIDGNEYREHYKFSNDGTVLKNYGYKSFDTACHTTPEWRENLLNVSRLKLSFNPDCIFFDQLGCCLKLCFDTTHPHGNRIDMDGMGREANIRAIRDILPDDKAIGTEWVNDRYCNLVDFIHGCGTGHSYSPDAFPDIYLHTFPEIPISNRNIHDDKDGFRDHLNYAFTYGMIFDAAIYRCRLIGVAGLPEYAAHLKKLLDIKDAYRKYFYHGKFRTMFGEALPAGIRAGRFEAEDGTSIAALWNTSGEDMRFTLCGRDVEVKAKDVAVAEV